MAWRAARRGLLEWISWANDLDENQYEWGIKKPLFSGFGLLWR